MNAYARQVPAASAVVRHAAASSRPPAVGPGPRHGSQIARALWQQPAGRPRLCYSGRARALFSGRFNVAIDDVRSLAAAALRHRILLNFEGQADGIRTDDIVQAALTATSG